jgi:hypothetical protein
MNDGNSTTTRLLTLLNISATRAGKRKRTDEFVPSQKLNKRKSITSTSEPAAFGHENTTIAEETLPGETTNVPEPQDNTDDFESESMQFLCALPDSFSNVYKLSRMHMRGILVVSLMRLVEHPEPPWTVVLGRHQK